MTADHPAAHAARNGTAHQPADPAGFTQAPPAAPLLLRRRDAAAACGVSVATWDRLASAAKVPAPVRLGGAVMWRAAELADWVAAGCPSRREWEARQVQGRPR